MNVNVNVEATWIKAKMEGATRNSEFGIRNETSRAKNEERGMGNEERKMKREK
jgi:hypothetical protein